MNKKKLKKFALLLWLKHNKDVLKRTKPKFSANF